MAHAPLPASGDPSSVRPERSGEAAKTRDELQRHRNRFLWGLALALLVSVGGGALLLGGARGQLARDVETRRTIVSLLGLAELVGRVGDDGEKVREVVSSWQSRQPAVAETRVLVGRRLEASTSRVDVGDKAAPRNLVLAEKEVFDRFQHLRGAVSANREEGATKPELLARVGDDGTRRLGAPLERDGEVVGLVEVVTVPLPAPKAPFPWVTLLAFVLPLLVFLGGARLVPAGKRPLGALAAALYAAGTLGFALAALADLQGFGLAQHERVATHAREQGELVKLLLGSALVSLDPAPEPGSWDRDLMRQPRGLLGPLGEIRPDAVAAELDGLRGDASGTFWAAAVLGLLLLGFVGLGGATATGGALKRNRQAYAYVAPAMIGTVVLVFFPFVYGIALSFTNQNIYNTADPLWDLWVGLKNYAQILGDFGVVKRAADGGLVWNYLNFYWTFFFTVAWTVTNVTFGVSFGLLLAIVLNTKDLAFRPVYRVLLILPWAMPNYITALIWKGMFHRQFGVVNQLLAMFGVEPISWFDTAFTSFLTAFATNGWLSFPFMMVVSLGALQSIPADIYEAARVDGATKWQQFRAITLPSLRPALVPAVILSVVWTFNMFNIIFLVTGGQPNGATEILITQAYKYAFERYQYGYAAAYATVIFAILLVYGNFQNRVTKATEAI